MKKQLSVVLFLAFCIPLQTSPLCIMVRVPHNFFKLALPWYELSISNEGYKVDPSQQEDVRITTVPEAVLKQYVLKSNQISAKAGLKAIPETVLKEYTPFSIVIEYKRPTGRTVLAQEPITEAGVIEKCYLVDYKIKEKKGFKEKIKEIVKKPQSYNNLKVYLRFKHPTYRGGGEDLIPCASYEIFEGRGLEIELKNDQGSYSCSTMIIK